MRLRQLFNVKEKPSFDQSPNKSEDKSNMDNSKRVMFEGGEEE